MDKAASCKDIVTDSDARNRLPGDIDRTPDKGALHRLRQAARTMAVEESQARREFASLLHDGPTQNLAAACMYLAALEHDNPEANDEHVKKVLELIGESLKTLRQIMAQLSPPDIFADGLPSALNWLGVRYEFRSQRKCTIHLAHNFPAVAPDYAAAIFQITRALLDLYCPDEETGDVALHLDKHNGDARFILRGARSEAASADELQQLHDRIALFGGTCIANDQDASTLTVTLPLT